LRTSDTDAATAKASLEGARERVTDLEKEVREERRKADQFSEQLAAANTALGEEKTRGKEREESNRQVLAEREKSITELKASIEQSKVALTETFKATGADVLKLTAESLLKQAKDQFEGQHKLSQQDLEARQKAIDTALVPLREQLEKNEKLTKDLGEKREGDVKMLGEQLKQIADLQQKASSAAQTLSSALRDNRQRGRWGEVSLRNIAELAGLVDNVDFSEQSSVQSGEGERLRPDMTVRLPGGRFVPIDAKVPMSAYLDSLDPALSDAERADRRWKHAQALRTHVRAHLRTRLGMAPARAPAPRQGGGLHPTHPRRRDGP
jgi:DNA recombination protein RmuC